MEAGPKLESGPPGPSIASDVLVEQESALTPQSGFYDAAKRLFDLVVGATVAVLMLPIIPVIALMIKLDSPGPVFFKQKRVGKNGKVFDFYKFRSMHEKAESQKKGRRGAERKGRTDLQGHGRSARHVRGQVSPPLELR